MAATYCATEQNEGDVPIRLFQIWLKTSAAGGTPRWGTSSSQRPIAPAPSCPSLAATTRKAHCRYTATPGLASSRNYGELLVPQRRCRLSSTCNRRGGGRQGSGARPRR